MPKIKRTASHSTCIPAVQLLYNKLVSSKDINKLSFGIINPCKTVQGNRRVKIFAESGCWLLKVRDFSATQELRIYSTEKDFEKFLTSEIKSLGFDVGGED